MTETATTPQQDTAPAVAPELAALQAQITELQAKAAEADKFKKDAEDSRFAAQYWEQEARKPVAPPTAKPKTDDEDTAVDVIEVLSREGKKGLDKLIAKQIKSQGFLSADEARTMIDQRAREIATSSELYEEYPELQDKSSSFFKEASLEFVRLQNQGIPTDVALKMAARTTELDFLKSGKRETPKERTDRETREAAAAPPSRRGARAVEEDEDEDAPFDENQKRVINAFKNFGVTEESYRKRAKGGVNVYRS